MATPLEFVDAAVNSEVALPSEIDVSRPAKRGEAQPQPAHEELR